MLHLIDGQVQLYGPGTASNNPLFARLTDGTTTASVNSGDGGLVVHVANGVAVTGTFWQATQPVSLASLPALVAGSAIIGRVGIDQATPGTTNGVVINNVSLAVTGTFALVFLVMLVVPAFVAYLVNRVGKRLVTRGLKDTLEEDTRPYFLYLRGFDEDTLRIDESVGRRGLGSASPAMASR